MLALANSVASHFSSRTIPMNTQSSHPALSAALPFLGSGAALVAMLAIAAISLAGAMMTAMPGL
jgi:hypothetical protein